METSTNTHPLPLDTDALDALIRRVIPNARGVAALRRLSGGASQETWAFEALLPEGKQRLILRRAPRADYQHETAAGLEIEAAVIKAVGRVGVPVPELQHVLEPDDRLGRGFITAHVEGETIARKILRDVEFAAIRQTLAGEFGQILARIHATERRALPALRSAGAPETLGLFRRGLDTVKPRPVFELALRWLEDNMPAPLRQLHLVHGDFRNGNLIIAPDGVRAVLDWELTHLGDPMEDLGWLCLTPWRFGVIDAPVGGLGRREQLYAGYQAAGGEAIDPKRVRWWEVAGSLRWGINCAEMVALFRDGTDRTVERAMIARRASENQVDLLRLLYCEN
jgi:aminoglycoside phosphotransferase (APT) family kinase protein